jgi:hypothetical protein
VVADLVSGVWPISNSAGDRPHCVGPFVLVEKGYWPTEAKDAHDSERAINAEIERQAGGRGKKLAQEIAPVSKDRIGKESARLAGFGNRETEKEKSPAQHRAFPLSSPVTSCAKKSLTSAKGQRGETEASHFSRGDCRRDVEKKSHRRGLEHDGWGY